MGVSPSAKRVSAWFEASDGELLICGNVFVWNFVVFRELVVGVGRRVVGVRL